jgi:hypothetical protein
MQMSPPDEPKNAIAGRFVSPGSEPRSSGPLLYSNNSELISGVFDFQIRFNRVIDKLGDELVLVHQATVAMSPQHAKRVWIILGQQLEEYQQKFGQIAVDPVAPQQDE